MFSKAIEMQRVEIRTVTEGKLNISGKDSVLTIIGALLDNEYKVTVTALSPAENAFFDEYEVEFSKGESRGEDPK